MAHTHNYVLNVMCKENRGGPEAEFLAKIQTKALRVFLLAIYSHFYSFALRFFFQLTQPLKVSVKENGEYPLPYDLKKSRQNPLV
jgi:hypothetical protein